MLSVPRAGIELLIDSSLSPFFGCLVDIVLVFSLVLMIIIKTSKPKVRITPEGAGPLLAVHTNGPRRTALPKQLLPESSTKETTASRPGAPGYGVSGCSPTPSLP